MTASKPTKKQFSVGILKIGNSNFKSSNFDLIDDNETEVITIGEETQGVKHVTKNIVEDRFVTIYFEEGSNLPRPDNVYNTTLQTEEINPRSKEQIERNTQLFVLVDIDKQRVYLSDFRRKNELEKYLTNKTKELTLVKNIINREDFVENLSSVEKIYISAAPSLFSEMGILGNELGSDRNNYGVGVKQMGVTIKFEENTIPEQLKKFIKNLFHQKDNNYIDGLVVSGRNDKKFERIFNSEGVVDKVDVDVYANDDGLFNKDDVFSALIGIIKK
jgi:hypothetical protein